MRDHLGLVQHSRKYSAILISTYRDIMEKNLLTFAFLCHSVKTKQVENNRIDVAERYWEKTMESPTQLIK